MILHTQRGQNKYLFSIGNKQFILLHPILKLLIELYKNNIDLKKWICDLDDEFVIQNLGMFNKKEIQLIYKKFKLLKSNGYFEKPDLDKEITGRLNAELVKQSLANTSSIVFEVTEKCNLACEYCCYGDKYNNYSERKAKDLSIEKAISLLDYIFELKHTPLNKSYAQTLQIGFYGGEPLLNIPFIDGIIKYLKTKESIRNSFILTMTTNGILLDKYKDYIVENQIHFSISLDGNKKNNSYRVFHNKKASFDLVFKNIKTFQAKYPIYFDEHVSFLSVLHKKNSAKEIMEFIKQEFNKETRISEITPIGINPENKRDYYKLYKNPFEDLQQQENYLESEKNILIRYANSTSVTKTIHQHCSFVFKNYSQLMFGNTKIKNIIPTGTCLPFYYKIFLTATGKILPCEKIGHQFSLARIRDDNKVNINFDKIANSYNNIYDKLEYQCSNCYNTMICGQCAFNLKDIEHEKPVCNGCLSYNEFAKYLSVQISYLEKYPNQYNYIMKKVIGR